MKGGIIGVFTVKFISVKNCFLSLHSKWLNKLNSNNTHLEWALFKLQGFFNSGTECDEIVQIVFHAVQNIHKIISVVFDINKNESAYCAVHKNPCESNGENAVNISAVFANSMKIRENSRLLLYQTRNIKSVKTVCVTPETTADWQILESSSDVIQNSLLDQIRVIYVDQVIPIWISKSFNLKVRVDSIETGSVIAGKLEQYSEVIVLQNSTNHFKKPNLCKIQQIPYIPGSDESYEDFDDADVKINSDDTFGYDDCNKIDNAVIVRCKNYKQQSKSFIFEIFNYILPSAICSCSDSYYSLNQTFSILSYLPIDWLNIKTSVIQPYDVYVNKKYFPFWKNYSDKKYIVCKLTRINGRNASSDKRSSVQEYRDYIQTSVFVRVFIIDSNTIHSNESSYNGTIPFIYMPDILSRLFDIESFGKIMLQVVADQKINFKELYRIQIIPLLDTTAEERNQILIKFEEKILSSDASSPILLNNFCIYEVQLEKKFYNVLIKFLPHCIPFIQITAKDLPNSHEQLQLEETTPLEFQKVSTNSRFRDLIPFSFWNNIIQELILQISIKLNLMDAYNDEEYDGIVKSNYTLLVGGLGMGKTSVMDLMHSLSQEMHICINVKRMSCKEFRGKSVTKLDKHFHELFMKCAYYEPSVLVIDDLDSLFQSQNEHEDSISIINHTNRISNTICDVFKQYVTYRITVIASVTDPNNLDSCLYSPRGNALFTNIIHIPLLNLEDRIEVLNKLVFDNMDHVNSNIQNVFLENLAKKMEGYCVQDFVDFKNKLSFEAMKNSVTAQEEVIIDENAIYKALSLVKPVSLQHIDFHKSSGISFTNVGGMDSVKQILTEIIIWPSMYPEVFKQCPIKNESGVLLYGAPGSGKTLLAAALAGECGINFISIKGPELLSKYVGNSEERVRNTFLKAESAKPCILFFDEFESLAHKRGNDFSGVTDRVVNQLLTEIDGVESRAGVWILAATSRPDLIDPALLRPGRLGTKVYCPLPDKEDRISILQVLTADIELSEDVDLSEIASIAENFTGADLQAVLYTACLYTSDIPTTEQTKASLIKLNQKQLINAVNETESSLNEKDRIQFERIYHQFSGSTQSFYVSDESLKLTFA